MFDTTPSDMPTKNRPANAGSSMNDNASRLDGPAKVSGRAKYGRDMYLKDALYIGFVRCPYGAATLKSANVDAARALPGVVEVDVTPGKDGRYHGHKMGQVVAESPLAVKRALRALKCTWEKKPVKTKITDTVTELPAPSAKTADHFKEAELTLEAVYTTPVQPHACLETHGGAVEWTQDKAIAYASTQGTSAARDGLDKHLNRPQSEIEVVCEYVGGGFGSKLGGPGKELQAAAGVAGRHKRSAYMFDSRSEDQTDTGMRPSSQTLARAAFKKDGTIIGGEIRTWGGVGIGGGGGCRIPSGRYRLGLRKGDDGHEDIPHNGGGVMPARAPAYPQGAFAEELLLDEIAGLCNMDPLTLKRRLASEDTYRDMMDMGARMIGWENRKPNGSQTTPVKVGYGLGTASWHGTGPGGNAEVAIHSDGSIEARSGTQDAGTGTRTVLGISAASGLGVPLSMITVRMGRSGLPRGPGSGGSQVTGNIAPTMMNAAQRAKEELLAVVAKAAGAGEDAVKEFDVKDGVITRNGQPHLEWKRACEKLPPEGIVAKNRGKIDAGQGGNQGVQFIKLAVDTETGVVRPLHVIAIQSCGKVIFRKGAESQVIGSVIQGISNALFETQVFDRNIGTVMNDNLESYKLLGPYDMPKIETVLWAKGQTGVRGIGEPPIVATSGAVACAIFNAIGRPVRDLPMTPDRILAAIASPAAEGAKS